MQALHNPLDYFQERAPQRVVSLVPSMTGSLMDFGLDSHLVGVTDFCPSETVVKIGGPKSPQVDVILELQPDLVLANQEENSKEAVEALIAAGVPVWLSFPKTVRAMLADLWTIASLFRNETAMDRIRPLEMSVEWAERFVLEQPGIRYFCPIWQDRLETGEGWWMTFNAQTYSDDVLRLAGGQNVFAERVRRYPLQAELDLMPAEDHAGRDTRYPRIGLAEVLAAQPEIIFLPDEPYAYSQEGVAEAAELFAETPAGKSGRIYTIDGSQITWPGTRLGQALADLPQYFS
jgi:ABC-type Fe3+-hydroxamate transport system substrate-binding protein